LFFATESLIHNIWTTKGNHHTFLGIAAACLSEDWEFKICHLGLKYISWMHKGKYLAVPFANIITKSDLHEKISIHFILSFFLFHGLNLSLTPPIKNTSWLRQQTQVQKTAQ
jgi:hypothetical protein